MNYTKEQLLELKRKKLLLLKARYDLKSFVKLHFEIHKGAEFFENWHIDYLCKILESTLPTRLNSAPAQENGSLGNHLADYANFGAVITDQVTPTPKLAQSYQSNTAMTNFVVGNGNLSQSTPSQEASPDLESSAIVESNSNLESTQIQDLEFAHEIQSLHTEGQTNGAVFCDDFGSFSSERAGSYLSGNDQTRTQKSTMHDRREQIPAGKIAQKTSQPEIITRLMVNMPPSYGKTEIIARNFIAWALGNFPHRKFFYVSYSDELCKKISNQVRDLLKSKFWAQVFGRSPQFIQDNASEFMLKEGGGLFCTTLKASLTGFHAHQILIDDPIKVSDMSSRAERNRVNQTFKESVLSRLQDRQSNITILMQRLGDEDLCGFLLDPKNFPQEAIDAWQVVKLQALNKEPCVYQIKDFVYERGANEPLAPHKHTLAELEDLKIKMGEDEFSTQYLQEPQVSEAGYFESVYFKTIPSYEMGEHNSYIFVDNATSLESSADNRAIALVGCEGLENRVRYILKDCVYGIWSEEETIAQLLSMMSENPKAQVYIESDGGGLTLERLLQKELSALNTKLKYQGKPPITNGVHLYPANRKVSKVEKIKAMRSYYNTGDLVFLHNARGLGQIKKELLAFNPAKPFRKDDCIDALASAMAHPNVVPKYRQKEESTTFSKTNYYKRLGNFRI